MNQLVRSDVLDGEILGEDATVRVLVTANPFKPETREMFVPAGFSLAEIVGIAGAARFPYEVAIWRLSILEQNWLRVRPKAGTTVVLRARMADPISGIIALVTSALSSLSTFVASLGVFGQILGVAASIGFNLLLGALFPPAKPKQVDNTEGVKGYSISASRNQATPFEPIPQVLGEHRMTPPYGARPYTESVGSDQYLRMIFVWGVGPHTVTDMKIGETPLSSFSDVEIEHFAGYDGQGLPSLYPSQVIEEPLSVELKMEDGWTTRTTAENVTEISIDLFWQNGLYVQYAKSGDKAPVNANIQVQYRPVGGEWADMGSQVFTGYWLKDAHRETIRRAVPSGQYDVRVMKGFEHPESKDYLVVDAVYLTAIRASRPGSPITFPKPLCMTVLRIRATSQLNGQLDTFNGLVQPLMTNVYGTPVVTSRLPADLFGFVLRGAANGRPVGDGQIDFPTLQRWYSSCFAEGWTYDIELTGRQSVYDLLLEIAAAGRAVPIFRDGLWSVVWDEPNAEIVQVFNPRNSWGFEASKEFPDVPHGFRVRFVNREKGYVDDERIVYDDGYSAANATKFEALEFPGVTSPGLIYRHGRFHLAQLRLRPEVYTLNVDFENLVVTRGDRVRIAHDVMLVGLASARVTAVDPATRSITLDEVLTIEDGKVYCLRVRSDTGGFELYSIDASVGERQTVRLSGVAPLPKVGDLCTFGEGEKDSAVFRVLSIERQTDLTATVTFVDDAPSIASADKGVIPAFQSNVTAPPDPYKFGPTDVRATVRAYLDQGFLLGAIRLDWLTPRQGTIASYQMEYKNAGVAAGSWRAAGTVPAPATSGEIVALEAGLFIARVRAIFDNGSPSRWIETETISTRGALTLPPAVTGFRITTTGDVSILSWDLSPDPSVQFYEVRFAASGDEWNVAVPLTAQAMPGVQVPTMVGTYFIKAGRANGARSSKAALIRSSVGALTGFNVVEVLDEATGGFAGAKRKVVVNNGTLRLGPRAVMSTWSTLANVSNLRAGQGGSETIGLAVEGVYSFSGSVDLGDVYTSRINATISAFGVNIGMVMRNWMRLSDVTSLSTTDPSQWAVVLEYQATDDDPADDPLWTNWQRIVVGDVTARALRFQLRLTGEAVGSLDRPYSMVTPVVHELSVSIDMPDRTVGIEDLDVPAIGRRISFTPPFRAVPAIVTNDQGMETGDVKIITDKTADGFTIRFFDMYGVPVARSIDVVAKGYGSMMP